MNIRSQIDARQFVAASAVLVGIIGTIVAAMILYMVGILVVHEVLAMGGAWESGGAVFAHVMSFAFNVPVLAFVAFVAARAVRGIGYYDYNCVRAALAVVGLYSTAAVVYLGLLTRGLV